MSALASGLATEEEAPMQRLLHCAEALRQLPERQSSIDSPIECLHPVGMPRRLCFLRDGLIAGVMTFKSKGWPEWRAHVSSKINAHGRIHPPHCRPSFHFRR